MARHIPVIGVLLKILDSYMSLKLLPTLSPIFLRMIGWGILLFIGLCIVAFSVLVWYGAYGAQHYTAKESTPVDVSDRIVPVQPPQFPIGVNPEKKEITENPRTQEFYEEHFDVSESELSFHAPWLQHVLGKLALFSLYQNLASASSRILVIQPGERHEQIAQNFKKILGWSGEEKTEFITLVTERIPSIREGKFQPGTYSVLRDATPSDVATLIADRFHSDVLEHYGPEIESVVSLEEALIVASLLEREAYDFEDMRHISGVIWNRLFSSMRLQIDATLQYVKGSNPQQPWWPQVRPSDKYIASLYNTYMHEGLPPTAIANPSPQAILAALNPSATECIFYFHDKKGGFHCTKTYEEHVSMLKKYYGRGK